jgi:hypothetical protein
MGAVTGIAGRYFHKHQLTNPLAAREMFYTVRNAFFAA